MACRRLSLATRLSRRVSTSSTARSRTRPSPKRTTSTTHRSRTSYRCRRSDRLRALGLRLFVLLREDLYDQPGHACRERGDLHDEEDQAQQSKDRVHDQPRIAPCPAHASSCWMRWARESFPTQPSSATKEPTPSAMWRGRSEGWTCPTSRPSVSATSSLSRAARRNLGRRP